MLREATTEDLRLAAAAVPVLIAEWRAHPDNPTGVSLIAGALTMMTNSAAAADAIVAAGGIQLAAAALRSHNKRGAVNVMEPLCCLLGNIGARSRRAKEIMHSDVPLLLLDCLETEQNVSPTVCLCLGSIAAQQHQATCEDTLPPVQHLFAPSTLASVMMPSSAWAVAQALVSAIPGQASLHCCHADAVGRR